MLELQAILHTLTAPAYRGGVLATLVTVEGSSYRRPGARLLLTQDGTRLGSISGGCLEEDIIARAHAVSRSGIAELVVYDTTSENDLVWGVGLGCHGIVQVLIENVPITPRWALEVAGNSAANNKTAVAVVWRASDPRQLGTSLAADLPSLPTDTGVFRNELNPPVRLIVLGAGDDAMPLVRLAKELGWHVTVGDPRLAFSTTARFPGADAVVVAPAAELVRKIEPPANAVVVIMTHHYVHDVPLLRDILPRGLPFVGLLGPKKRALQIISDLREQGHAITPEHLERLHAPVGLDLGAETPEEVALSIISEMRATLGKREGRPLRERERPIHG